MTGKIAYGLVVGALLLGGTAQAEEARKLLESRESLYNNIYVYQQGPLGKERARDS